MFGKLTKFNIKEVGMVMLPLYAAMVVLAFAAGMAMRFSITRGAQELVASTVPGVITLILIIVYGVLNLAMGIVTIVMIVKNFRDNLFSGRGYLMNTLPASPAQQVLSKLLAGMLFLVGGGAAAVGSGTIILLWVLRKDDWAEMIRSFEYTFGESGPIDKVISEVVILAVIWAVQVIAKMYFSISLGNLWRGHRLLGAACLFIGLSLLQTWIGHLLTKVSQDASIGYSMMENGIALTFGIRGDAGLLTLKQMLFACGQDAVYIALFLCGTIWVLKYRLDLQ